MGNWNRFLPSKFTSSHHPTTALTLCPAGIESPEALNANFEPFLLISPLPQTAVSLDARGHDSKERMNPVAVVVPGLFRLN